MANPEDDNTFESKAENIDEIIGCSSKEPWYTRAYKSRLLVPILGAAIIISGYGTYRHYKHEKTERKAAATETQKVVTPTPAYAPPVSTPGKPSESNNLEAVTEIAGASASKNPLVKIRCPDGTIVEMYQVDSRLRPDNVCSGSAIAAEYSPEYNRNSGVEVTVEDGTGLEGRFAEGIPGIEQAEKVYASQPYVKHRNRICQTYGDKELCPALDYNLNTSQETVFSIVLSPDRKIAAVLTGINTTTRAYATELVTDNNGLILRTGETELLLEYRLGSEPRMKNIEWLDNLNLNIVSVDTVRENGTSRQVDVITPRHIERIEYY